MYINDIVVWSNDRKFGNINGNNEIFLRNAYCLCDLYATLMQNTLRTDNAKKIILYPHSDCHVILYDPKRTSGVLGYLHEHDLSGYDHLSRLKKKMVINDYLRDALVMCCNINNWDAKIIHQVHQHIIDMDWTNVKILPAKIKHDNKDGININVCALFEIDIIYYYISFAFNGIEYHRASIDNELPTDAPFSRVKFSVVYKSNEDCLHVTRLPEKYTVNIKMVYPSNNTA